MCLDPSNLPRPCDSSCFDSNEIPVQADLYDALSSQVTTVVVPSDATNNVADVAFSREYVHSDEEEKEVSACGKILDVPAEIERCEEEILVLTTLKDTAQACFHAVTTSTPGDQTESDDVPTREAELAVRVLEALADDAGPTEGLDVRIRLQHAGKDSATSLRPSRSWASDSGAVLGRGTALHVTWNELFRFKAAEKLTACGPGSLVLAVVREDGGEVASLEVSLECLENQKVHHQWCTIGCGWRIYIAMQFVRSAADVLQNHIADFEARLAAARSKLQSARIAVQNHPDSKFARNGHPASQARLAWKTTLSTT